MKVAHIAGAKAGDARLKGTHMTALKRFLVCLVTIVTIACLTTGCNTIEGAGRDIEAGGEAIQDVAD
jgi:predicted small secreted protein